MSRRRPPEPFSDADIAGALADPDIARIVEALRVAPSGF
jgi:hypothetical protein